MGMLAKEYSPTAFQPLPFLAGGDPVLCCLGTGLRPRPSTSLLFKAKGSVLPPAPGEWPLLGQREKSSSSWGPWACVSRLAFLLPGLVGRWPGRKGRSHPSFTSGSPPPGQETRLLLTLGTLRGLELALKECPIYLRTSNPPRWGLSGVNL